VIGSGKFAAIRTSRVLYRRSRVSNRSRERERERLAFHKDNTFRRRARIKSKNNFHPLPEVAVLGVRGRKISKRVYAKGGGGEEQPSEEYMVLSWLAFITLMDLMQKQLLPAVWEAAKLLSDDWNETFASPGRQETVV
jgi:hypothetical protein